KMPGDVHIAPDGRRVAYVVSETDWERNEEISHIYVSTTEDEPANRQVTRGYASETNPMWSPDGKWLAFFTTRTEDDPEDTDYDDDPKAQVWILPMDG